MMLEICTYLWWYLHDLYWAFFLYLRLMCCVILDSRAPPRYSLESKQLVIDLLGVSGISTFSQILIFTKPDGSLIPFLGATVTGIF